MSPQTRRTLRIDDPVAGDACHMAPLGSGQGASGRLRDIELDEIHPNPSQPRKRFDETSLAALADSIRERGVLQPIIVQPRPGDGFELIAGERRWRASQIAGVPRIPALVAQPVIAGQSIELALIENVAREDLGVIEEARTIAALLDELNVTATTLARRLGRSRSDLAHTVRLLDLPRPGDRADRWRQAVERPWEGAADRARPLPAAGARQARGRRRLVGPRPRGRDRPSSAAANCSATAPRPGGGRRQVPRCPHAGHRMRDRGPTPSPRLSGDPRSERRRPAHIPARRCFR